MDQDKLNNIQNTAQGLRAREEGKRPWGRQVITGLLLLILIGVEVALLFYMPTAERPESFWEAVSKRMEKERIAVSKRMEKERIAAEKRAEREWIAAAELAETEERAERECIAADRRAEKSDAVAAGKLFLDKGGHALWRVLGGQFEVKDRGFFYKPAHSFIHVSTFLMGETKVTYGEWRSVTLWAKAKGYHLLHEGQGTSARHPVTHIQWHEAVVWCNAKSEMEGLLPCYKVDGTVYRGRLEGARDSTVNCDWNANGYRLPTEAEWEYAARERLALKNEIRYGMERNGRDDMRGDQWEWCWDWYAEGYSGGDDDPEGPLGGSSRVLRRGAISGWSNERKAGDWARWDSGSIGFRLARRPRSEEVFQDKEWIRREKMQGEMALSRWAEKEKLLKAQIAASRWEEKEKLLKAYQASPEYAGKMLRARELEVRKAREMEEAREASKLLKEKSEKETEDAEDAEDARRRAARELALDKGVKDSLGRRYAFIPRGEFEMGSSLEADAPVKQVWVASFVMGQSEITFGEWSDTLLWSKDHGYEIQSPGLGAGSSHPVTMVSWFDVVAWSNAKSEREGLTPCYYTGKNLEKMLVYKKSGISGDAPMLDKEATGYRLPTEAEWEKAARGGRVDQIYPNGNTLTKKHANFLNAGGGTLPVMSLEPNDYGLFDMAGNVWEWCWDVYPEQLGARGVRGGGWELNAASCRVAFVAAMLPDTKTNDRGFRLVRRFP